MLTNSHCLAFTFLLCDFHREQAWERWLDTLSYGCRDVKDIVLGLLKMIANSQTEGEYKSRRIRLDDTLSN